MSIKTTRYITRKEAIDRIRMINELAIQKDYRKIGWMCFEPKCSPQEFVETYTPVDTAELEMWTDDMLIDKMDEPFMRYSMFDNYLIGD